MNTALQIFNTDIKPGSQTTIDLPLPALYTHTPTYMPVRVIRGRKAGPCLLVNAALHGDEINGVEIIRRLLALPQLKRIQGTLIAVPVVNVFGFLHRTRYLPDRRDLNRCFPGSDKGSLGSRVASLFIEELFNKATHGIDLHTGAVYRDNLPQIRAGLSLPGISDMAKAFGTPVILDSGERLIDGSLRKFAAENDIPFLVYEAGEALRFDELAIRAGVRGIVSVMRNLGMLRASKRRPAESVIAQRSSWMRAPQSGIVRAAKALGSRVAENEIIAYVSDPFGEQESPITTRFSGIIVGRSNMPLVTEGEALFNIASVAKPGQVAQVVENYHEDLADAQELADPNDATLED